MDIRYLLTLIVFGALVDSIDPCIFALYISLLLTSSVSGLKRVLKIATAFVSSVFLGYLVFGAILRVIVVSWQVPRWVLTAVLIVYAIAMLIYTIFFEGEGSEAVCREDRIACRIASSLKFDRFAKAETSILAVSLLGFLASFTLLPCSAGMYIAFNFVTANLGLWAWLPLAMLYTAIFVLPLVIITVAVIGLTKIKRVYEAALSKQRILKIAASIAMIAIAMWISL
ncbi:MAG: hypothetical protein QW348_07355 [Ignisphaera sp.]